MNIAHDTRDNIVQFPTDEERQDYQLNDGTWFRLNRQIFIDLYCKSGLSKQEIQVVSTVLLLTYACRPKSKPENEISTEAFEICTGLKKKRIWEIIRDLSARNVLIKNGDKIKYNKYTSTWGNNKKINSSAEKIAQCQKTSTANSASQLALECFSTSTNFDTTPFKSLRKREEGGVASLHTPPNIDTGHGLDDGNKNKKTGNRINSEWNDLPSEWKEKVNTLLTNKNLVIKTNVDIESIKFLNYWQSATKNATKLDWYKAWVNWVLRDAAPAKPIKSINKQTQLEANNRSIAEEWLRESSHD